MFTEISSAPVGVRFDIPALHQGQIIEVAYADDKPEPGESAARSARYKRVIDRSIAPGRPGRVTYYQRGAGAVRS